MIQTKRRDYGSLVVGSVALLLGLGIGYVDSRPNWDDTGITVGTLIIAAAAFALIRPRYWWIWSLLVGIGVPAQNLAAGRAAAVIAVVFALLGGGIAAVIGSRLRSA